MNYQTTMILAGLLSASLVNLSPGAELYVSPGGSDLNPGTELEPFRTIGRAREAARQEIAGGLKEPLAVFLRAGTYELSEMLTFGPQDSGTASTPVTYASAAGETAVLSGGRRITGWRQAEDGTWTVNLPEVREGKWFFRQLTVNGQRATRARWPNKDGELVIESVAGGVKEFTFNKPLPVNILPDSAAELVVYENWSVTRGLIANASPQQVTTATAMGWVGHESTTASSGKPAFIEHVRSFVDEPGEWFLDRNTGDLTYLPRPGEHPDEALVVAPVLEQLIKLTGTDGQAVEYLNFKRLGFSDTRFPLPSFGYNEIQAAHTGTAFQTEDFHVQPVAIECVQAEHCRFDNCSFAHFGASGIGFGPGCKMNTVSACQITDVGGNGVMVGWRGTGELKPGRKELAADWADAAMIPSGNEVSNCQIQRCGAESTGAVGIFVAFSADTRIAHNHVHDMPYTGISIGYKWDTAESSMTRCIVEFNHIHDVMKVLADGAGIYTLGYQPGTVLRGNHIHDVHRSQFAHGGAPNNGFFLDQGSKGYLLEENVVYATSGEPVRFNQSQHEWQQWKDNFLGGQNAPEDPKAQEIIRKAGPR